MSSSFKYPFTSPILFDSQIEEVVFNEVKELLIEIINKPIITANLIFLTEMKNNYTVYVEDVLKYKNLYTYMVKESTKMYYQLCENNMVSSFPPGHELHPEICWFFVSFANNFIPLHTHTNESQSFRKGAPPFEVNGTMYLTSFDVDKEINDPSNTSVMNHSLPNPMESRYDNLENMERKRSGTSKGKININIKEGIDLSIFPEARTGFVIDNNRTHSTNPFSSDQVRISFVYNSSCLISPGPKGKSIPRFASTKLHPSKKLHPDGEMRYLYTPPSYNLPPEVIEKITNALPS